tara:strand:- start:1881 stop:2405 length:525 start_codon:yes stop_codon:yes gene_type:complete
VSQRDSGYERLDRDLYETPEWVTQAVILHLGHGGCVWEPAAGSGKMARVLAQEFDVVETDISTGEDFLKQEHSLAYVTMIVTNPPYRHAREFVEQALKLTKSHKGRVAMLLRTDFDHAKSRKHLFSNCPQFSKKLVLTKRIIWFERKGAAPSFNHAWYIWDWENEGKPVLAYDV